MPSEVRLENRAAGGGRLGDGSHLASGSIRRARALRPHPGRRSIGPPVGNRRLLSHRHRPGHPVFLAVSPGDERGGADLRRVRRGNHPGVLLLLPGARPDLPAVEVRVVFHAADNLHGVRRRPPPALPFSGGGTYHGHAARPAGLSARRPSGSWEAISSCTRSSSRRSCAGTATCGT